MVGGEYAVHMGEALFDPVADGGLTRHAAAEEDLLPGMAALGVGQGAQIAEYTLIRVLPDGAGVHDDHIRTLGLLDDGIPGLGQVTPELFGVGFILLTAIGLHIGGGCYIFRLPVGSDLITIGELVIQLGFRNDSGFGVHGKVLRWIRYQL